MLASNEELKNQIFHYYILTLNFYGNNFLLSPTYILDIKISWIGFLVHVGNQQSDPKILRFDPLSPCILFFLSKIGKCQSILKIVSSSFPHIKNIVEVVTEIRRS